MKNKDFYAFLAVVIIAGMSSYFFVEVPKQKVAMLGALLLIACAYAAVWVAALSPPPGIEEEAPVDPAPRTYAPSPDPKWPEEPKGKPQAIVSVDARVFARLDYVFRPGETYVKAKAQNVLSSSEFASALTIREREWLENDPGHRQIIPYVMVRRTDADGTTRYLAYQRTSKVGESRLAGKVSIGFGGHIDISDVWMSAPSLPFIIDVEQTVLRAAYRECGEELKLSTPMNLLAHLEYGNAFIVRNDGVNAVHLGVVMFLNLPDGVEMTCKEDELETLGMLTARELLLHHIQGTMGLEAWSLDFLSHTA